MTTPLAQAALRAMMVNGKYIDQTTGRPAYLGPNNEPGYAAAQRPVGSLEHKMPDGRVAYYMPKAQVPQVNPGTLKPKLPTAAQGSTSLPFDGDAALQQAQLQAQKNMFEAQATTEQGRIQREHGLQKRAVEDQMPNAQRGLLEDYAGRGLAYSSGYAYDQGDQQSQFAKLLSELDQGKTDGLADLLRQRGAFNDSWSTQLQAVQAAAARRLSEQAGNLGLNDPEPTGNEELLNGLFPGMEPNPTPMPAPATPAPAPAPRAQTAEEKAWAAYVAYNPTNAARVQQEAQAKKEREWAAYVAYNPTNAAKVAAAARR